MSGQGGTAMVIAPDIILDLVFARGRAAVEAVKLFDAIALDQDAGVTGRPAYVTHTTLTDVYTTVLNAAGMGSAQWIVYRLLRLLAVAPMRTEDFREAVRWSSDVELHEAMLFAACQCVGARYLVTNDDFGLKRSPVERRTAAEMLPLFRRSEPNSVRQPTLAP